MPSLRPVLLATLAALLTSVLPAAPASASASASEDPTWTEPSILGSRARDVAMDANTTGDAVVAWIGANGVKASYRPAGKDWERPVLLGRTEEEDDLVDVFVDDRGRATVGWWIDGGGDGHLVLADRSLAGSWSRDRLTRYGGQCCMILSPSLAMDESGNLLFRYWTGSDEMGGGNHHYWRTADRRWVRSAASSNSTDPFLAYDGRATFSSGGDGVRVLDVVVGPDGGTSEKVWTGAGVAAPTMAVNAGGDLVLATFADEWTADEYNGAGGAGRTVVLARPAGADWRELAIGADDERVRRPAVAVDDRGRVVVAYQRATDRALVVRTGTLDSGLGEAVELAPSMHSVEVAAGTRSGAAVTWQTTEGGPLLAAFRPWSGEWGDPTQLAPQVGALEDVVAYPNGMFTSAYRSDGAAHWVDLVHDHRGPVTTMLAPARSVSTSTRIRVRWDVRDAVSRPESADVRVRRERRDGSLGAWSVWRQATTRSDARFDGRPGRRYCFAARGRDRVGNLGGWSERLCTVTPRG